MKFGEEIVIRGGTVIDQTGTRRADVVIADGRILRVGTDLTAARMLDASGCFVTPGLVEIGAQLGQPGREGQESIISASRAAVLGGFTAVVARPDTEPVIDSPAVVAEIRSFAAHALCDVLPSATVTIGGKGHGRLSPMAELAAIGVRFFVDEGVGIAEPATLRRALDYAAELGVLIGQHAEEASLAAGGCVHEGEWSARLGLAGIPAEAEELGVMSALAMARLTAAPLHFRRLSTAGSLAMVAAARRGGVAVSADATINHGILTHDALAGFDPNAIFRPPLRPREDVDAVRAGLNSGVLSVLSSDHCPHPPQAKEVPLDEAAPGAVGLETTLSLAVGELGLDVADVFARLSWGPAQLLGVSGVHGGPISAGAPANICVFDPTERWTFDPATGASRGRNSPFGGRSLVGRVRHTLVHGEVVVLQGKAQR